MSNLSLESSPEISEIAISPRDEGRVGGGGAGLRKRVQLPDETVRIMTRRVSSCSCQKSPGGVAGCCEGTDGCEALPRPWEAEPK